MAEFPDLGKHCSQQDCKQLDFLPVKCDACQRVFCADHFSYVSHNCPESYKKDNQVPVCPLCNIPIPLKKGETPDIVVGRHIDTDCQSDPAKEKRKVYTNRCSVKGCKTKELVPLRCEKCRKNYCLKHRHEQDHKCQGFQGSGSGISNAGAAAVNRQATSSSTGPFRAPHSKPQQTSMSSLGRDLERERQARQAQQRAPGNMRAMQAGMSEDEAMARALAMSMQESAQPKSSSQRNEPGSQEDADLALARALQESEREAARERDRQRYRQESQKKDSSCNVS